MSMENQNEAAVEKKKSPVWMIIVAAVIVIAAIVAIVVFAGKGKGKDVSQQLEKAREYAADKDYDKAIAEYLDVIKADSGNTDAYLELAALYVKTEQPKKAADILEEAKKKVGDSDQDRVDKGIAELDKKTVTSDDNNGTKQVADNKDATNNDGTDKKTSTNTDGENNTPKNENPADQQNSEGTPIAQNNTEDLPMLEEDNGPAPDIIPELELNPLASREYNAAGQLVKTEYTDPYTGEYTYYVREYDSNGKCILGTMHMVLNTQINGASGQADIKDFIDDYDSNERIIKKTYLSADESVFNYITYEYDARGDCIKETSYDRDGSVSDYRVYEYDSDGKCIKYTYYWNGKPTDSYEYDKQGRLVKQYYFNDDGSVNTYYIFEGYDDQGRPIRTTLYDDKGRMISVEEIVGDVVKVKSYDEDGNLIYEEELPAYGGGGYDDYSGDYGGGDYYNGGDTAGGYGMQEPVCEYDSEGRVTKITFLKADGSVDYYQIFEYDANGYVIGNSTYNADGSPR